MARKGLPVIGVFDSGYGGLTVLRALLRDLPDRSFRYFGDHALAPYGNRSAEEIHALTRAAVERLFGLGCRLVVVACNTAAATSLRRLQQTWLPAYHPDRRVLGVLVPVVEAITGVAWMAPPPARHPGPGGRTVAVFATRQTVLSNAYPIEIGKRAPDVTVVQQACPTLVDLIESGQPVERIRHAVEDYVDQLMGRLPSGRPDVAVLGCTHYPLIADLFAEALPSGVEVLSQPDLVARSLSAYLLRHPELDRRDAAPQVGFLTSGDPVQVSRRSTAFLGCRVDFRHASGYPSNASAVSS